MNDLDKVIDEILKVEQGYVNNPNDSGGPTNMGITEAVARANGYNGPMENLPAFIARSIYRKRYIIEPQFDRVYDVDPYVGLELVDTGVNMGPSVASTMLQRWLNGFNYAGSHYADVFVDGRIGDVTIESFKAFKQWRGNEGCMVLCYALNGTQAARYLEIAEKRIKDRNALYGWVKNRVMTQLQKMKV